MKFYLKMLSGRHPRAELTALQIGPQDGFKGWVSEAKGGNGKIGKEGGKGKGERGKGRRGVVSHPISISSFSYLDLMSLFKISFHIVSVAF